MLGHLAMILLFRHLIFLRAAARRAAACIPAKMAGSSSAETAAFTRASSTTQIAPRFIVFVGGNAQKYDRRAKTTVVVEDGGTAIVGGLVTTKRADTFRGLPGLGSLFTRQISNDERLQVSVLIRPTLVDPLKKISEGRVLTHMDPQTYQQQILSELKRLGAL